MPPADTEPCEKVGYLPEAFYLGRLNGSAKRGENQGGAGEEVWSRRAGRPHAGGVMSAPECLL